MSDKTVELVSPQDVTASVPSDISQEEIERNAKLFLVELNSLLSKPWQSEEDTRKAVFDFGKLDYCLKTRKKIVKTLASWLDEKGWNCRFYSYGEKCGLEIYHPTIKPPFGWKWFR